MAVIDAVPVGSEASTTEVTRLLLREDEVVQIQELLEGLAAHHSSIEDPAFHHRASLYAHDLPQRLREVAIDFRQCEPGSALFIVSGYPIEDAKVGPTPAHWETERDGGRAREEAMLLVLLGALLGDCIGWATQQDGRIVHDIFPIRGNEGEQLGTGSEQLLWWHTEDAFHPFRGDYIGMLCLRNPDRVPTTFLSVAELDLDPRHRDLLFEPRYTIRPDESHLLKNKAHDREVDGDLAASYSQIERMQSQPEKIPVLYGDLSRPYIRVDPYFMDRLDGDPEAQEALDALVATVDGRLHDLALEAGDYCFIDNFQAVHGRRPFKARYDGTDRWMKRVNVVRDLRKSRAGRASAESRVIL